MDALRLSLSDAAKQLGMAPNSVRSRWKAGKLRGERDNTGKVWVWLDPATPSNQRLSKPTIEGFEAVSKGSIEIPTDREIDALRDHIDTLKADLASTAAQRDAWQRQAETLLAQQNIAHAPRRSFFSLFRT